MQGRDIPGIHYGCQNLGLMIGIIVTELNRLLFRRTGAFNHGPYKLIFLGKHQDMGIPIKLAGESTERVLIRIIDIFRTIAVRICYPGHVMFVPGVVCGIFV